MIYYTEDYEYNNPRAFLDEEGLFLIDDPHLHTPEGYTYTELVEWYKLNEFFGVPNCETDEDLHKAAALEVAENTKRSIYNDARFWKVHYIGNHDTEAGEHQLTAELLATRNMDVLVIPDHPRYPRNWVYYTSTDSILG